jgi:hypothetical protein
MRPGTARAARRGREAAGVENVTEMRRLPSPAPRPQALAFDGTRLWMGSLLSRRLYSIDPATWTARDEGAVPGNPWSITVVGDEFRLLCGEGDNDDRFIRRFVPGHGFKTRAIPAPENTGSQLSYDGERLYLSQAYNRKILSLDETGAVGSVIGVPRDISGQVVVDGRFYLVTTVDEDGDEHYLTRVDTRGPAPVIDDLARIPWRVRALAFDGTYFWTNHREADQMVAFARPDA